MATDARAVVDHSVQSAYSDPRGWAHLLDDVDRTVDGVAFMARNVVAHYRAQAAELPESSREEISLRWADAILETDQRRNHASLNTDRPVRDRVQGCCRDHTLLAVAAPRHGGVPARSRVGFATYFSTTWNHDHVIVEAWLDGRWRRFDPEIASPIPRLEHPTDIAPGPHSPFLTAAHVWLAHRAGSIDVRRFGVDEGLGFDGDWFVYGYVIAEVAHRFGDELLLWDVWGAQCRSLADAPADDIALVDEIARLLVRADEGDLAAERELLGRYREDARLHPGRHIHSFSPTGRADEVDLVTRKTAPAR